MAIRTAKPAGSKAAKPQMAAAVPFSSGGSTAEAKPNSGATPNSLRGLPPPPVTAEMRRAMIAEAAYRIAEQRGFAQGRDVEDWLLAEKQIDAELSPRARW
ncbi:MAG TPA: DUF2934 domain-containing protein [Steroidobacteraceae bacterium]|nr:DUF2934 domain-containing protein [Steroidobacteraceae bacterium]